MKEKPNLLTESVTPPYLFGDFHSAHPALVACLKPLERMSQTNHSVLLMGESGCGKEVLARAIHQKSPRGQHAFIAVNCASIPEKLLESELFGYERGAFTGADGKKPGQFVLADSGTLFLDEIAEMPKPLQPKLLRALETKRIQPLGGTKSILTDFRLICATNCDLEAMVERGAFRTDLYHRIQGFTLRIPAAGATGRYPGPRRVFLEAGYGDIRKADCWNLAWRLVPVLRPRLARKRT
jgi:transcriptional regulator with PAS, ATPase and Fis domain